MLALSPLTLLDVSSLAQKALEASRQYRCFLIIKERNSNDLDC